MDGFSVSQLADGSLHVPSWWFIHLLTIYLILAHFISPFLFCTPLHWCLCMCACLLTRGVHVQKPEDNLGTAVSLLWDCLSLAWSTPNRLDWLVIQPQAPSNFFVSLSLSFFSFWHMYWWSKSGPRPVFYQLNHAPLLSDFTIWFC